MCFKTFFILLFILLLIQHNCGHQLRNPLYNL